MRSADERYRLADGVFGFFRFCPAEARGLVARVDAILRTALDEHRRIDLVVLPEQATGEEA